MRVRPVLLAISFCVTGCATPPQQAASPAAAASAAPSAAAAAAPSNTVQQPQRESRYRTGSRLPLSDDDAGSGTVTGASRDAYEDDRRNMVTPQKW
jgi:hypothetical protein